MAGSARSPAHHFKMFMALAVKSTKSSVKPPRWPISAFFVRTGSCTRAASSCFGRRANRITGEVALKFGAPRPAAAYHIHLYTSASAANVSRETVIMTERIRIPRGCFLIMRVKFPNPRPGLSRSRRTSRLYRRHQKNLAVRLVGGQPPSSLNRHSAAIRPILKSVMRYVAEVVGQAAPIGLWPEWDGYAL